MDCCSKLLKDNSCIRTSDMKKFDNLNERKYTREKCLKKTLPIKSFTVRASCAPYNDCKRKLKYGGVRKNAICILHQNNNNITGTIRFTQKNKNLIIEYEIYGLTDGLHGFHIHEYGDVSDNCLSACSHFNPYNKKHGGLNSNERHLGDLGNVYSKNKLAKGKIIDTFLSLNPKHLHSIIGRSVIVHEKEDDLGKGMNEESLKTGNAGARLACGVIGLSKK